MFNFLTKAKDIAADAKSTITEIKAEVATQKSTRDELIKKKDDLYLQPLPKEDIKQVIFDYIDRQAQLYLDDGGMSNIIKPLTFPVRNTPTSLPNARNKAINLYELDAGVKLNGGFEYNIFGFENLSIFNGYAFSLGGKRDLCFFLGDVLKQKIEAHFDAFFPSGWDSYKPGLPLAQRRPLIAELDAQIATIDTTIKELEHHLRVISGAAKV